MRQQPATVKLLLEAVFSVQFISRLYNKDQQDRPELLSVVSCKSAAIQQGCEHGSRGISNVGSHYQAVTSEDIGDFVCAAVTVICRVCKSHATVIVTCIVIAWKGKCCCGAREAVRLLWWRSELLLEQKTLPTETTQCTVHLTTLQDATVHTGSTHADVSW
jgi:hypothetical protein